MIATIINALVVIVGCLVGLVVKDRLTENMSDTIMKGLGLSVLCIGITGAIKAEDSLQLIICVALGSLIGEIIDIDKRLNNLGVFLEEKINKRSKNKDKGNVSIAQGFVTSSLLFCVGAMAVVGCLESGLKGDNTTIYAKTVLDGVGSIIFTSSLGIGVMLSSVTILVYQGSITLFAGFLSGILTDVVIANMSAVGNVLIVGLGLNVVGASKIKIANLLPAMFLPILFDIVPKIFNMYFG